MKTFAKQKISFSTMSNKEKLYTRQLFDIVPRLSFFRKKGFFILFSFFSILFLLLGCTQGQNNVPSAEQLALKECKALCNAALPRSDIDWPSGPCIGNPMQQNSDYACDIAHNPRTAVDDKAENQCSAFREGRAKHFVELDAECNLIKLN